MMYDFDVGVAGGQPIGDLAGAIAAAIVDHYDFVVPRNPRQFRLERRDHPLEVTLFVMARQKYAEASNSVI
jgi:hypothetical protein